MDKHMNEINTIMPQLQSGGINFDDEIKALLILSSLPQSLEGTITMVSSQSRGEKLRFDDVQNLVLGEEMRRKLEGVSMDVARVMKKRGKGRSSSGESQGCGKLKCFHCDKEGRKKWDYPDLKIHEAKGDWLADRDGETNVYEEKFMLYDRTVVAIVEILRKSGSSTQLQGSILLQDRKTLLLTELVTLEK